MMGRNPKSGEVFSMGADNQGGSHIGRWLRDEETGDAILELVGVTSQGEEGGLKMRHRMTDKDTLWVVIESESAEPVKVKLVRVEAKKKK